MNILLLPFSWLYALVMVCRNLAYDWGMFVVHDPGVPVISVGNLTAGGTGKTPLTEYIVGYLRSKHARVAVVSRGYRRKSRGVVVVSDGRSVVVDATWGGDEPVQIAAKFPGVPVVVGERRVDAARVAVDTLGAEVIVLDDGFQHRGIKRNLDILVMDARKDITSERLIPAGMRREPLNAIRRAGLVAFSRAEELVGWAPKMHRWYAGEDVLYRYESSTARRAGDHSPIPLAVLRSKRAFAFSGIGDHRGFVDSLRQLGFDVVGNKRFADHHMYTSDELAALGHDAKECGAQILLTTEKDAVRLGATFPATMDILNTCSLFYIPVTVAITRGGAILEDAIDRCLEWR